MWVVIFTIVLLVFLNRGTKKQREERAKSLETTKRIFECRDLTVESIKTRYKNREEWDEYLSRNCPQYVYYSHLLDYAERFNNLINELDFPVKVKLEDLYKDVWAAGHDYERGLEVFVNAILAVGEGAYIDTYYHLHWEMRTPRFGWTLVPTQNDANNVLDNFFCANLGGCNRQYFYHIYMKWLRRALIEKGLKVDICANLNETGKPFADICVDLDDPVLEEELRNGRWGEYRVTYSFFPPNFNLGDWFYAGGKPAGAEGPSRYTPPKTMKPKQGNFNEEWTARVNG